MSADESPARPPAAAEPGADPLDGTFRWWLIDRISESWLPPLLFGAVSIACGLVTILRPEGAIRFIAIVFGLQLLFFGGHRLVRSMATDRSGRRRWRAAAVGVVSTILGVLSLRDLARTIAVLGVLFGLFGLVAGTAGLISAVASGQPRKAASGLLGLVAGALLLIAPEVSLFWVTILIGVGMAVVGVMAVAEAATCRRAGALPHPDW